MRWSSPPKRPRAVSLLNPSAPCTARLEGWKQNRGKASRSTPFHHWFPDGTVVPSAKSPLWRRISPTRRLSLRIRGSQRPSLCSRKRDSWQIWYRETDRMLRSSPSRPLSRCAKSKHNQQQTRSHSPFSIAPDKKSSAVSIYDAGIDEWMDAGIIC